MIEPKIKTSFLRLTHAAITDSSYDFVWNAMRLRLAQIATISTLRFDKKIGFEFKKYLLLHLLNSERIDYLTQFHSFILSFTGTDL